MKKNFGAAILLAGAMCLSAPVFAGTLTFSGTIDGTEPTWDNPDTLAATLTGYGTFEFTVDTDGTYSILSAYAGDASLDENLDGMLSLYASPFDAMTAGPALVFDDDYTAGDVGDLAAFDASCVGQNCSGFSAMLTAGTTYTLVQTSFTDVANSFGQPTGDYTTTITGPGEISGSPIPVPAAIWFMLSGLVGLFGMKRRS